MRGWLNDVRSYIPPVGIGEKMRGAALCTVVHSKIHGIKAGDTVIAQVCHVFYMLTSRVLDGASTL
jgi:NADPH-dependent curcumin reductase CurA